jgi:cation transport protein ChaC
MTPSLSCSAHSLALLAVVRQQLADRLARGGSFWVFAYASLLWRPEFEADAVRFARVWGYHRALRMRSSVNRGTPDCPGLVFALLRGGSCRGQVHRVPTAGATAVLDALWTREMPNGVYTPRWLPCRTDDGELVEALAFTLPADSAHLTPRLDDGRLLAILQHARGRYGTTLDYLARTAHRLTELGIHDGEVMRLLALARRHALPVPSLQVGNGD